MCGRFCNTLGKDVFSLYDLPFSDALPPEELYNIAPMEEAWVILPDLSLGPLRWGFLPSGEEDPRRATKMINARSEDLLNRPNYRRAFERGQRCLVPCDGFYEFQGKGREGRAFRFRPRRERGWLLAGLTSRWVHPSEGTTRHTFTILTTRPNGVVAPHHDRMPLVVRPEHRDDWFRANRYDPKSSKLAPPPDEDTLVDEVDPRVRSVSFKAAECHRVVQKEEAFDWLKG